MNSLIQYIYCELYHTITSQSRCFPHLFIISASRVQTYYKINSSDFRLKYIKVMVNMKTTTLLISFEQHNYSGVFKTEMLASLESQYRPKDRVTIISGSTSFKLFNYSTCTVELITTNHRDVWMKTFIPSSKWRLFIHVSIEEHSSIVLLRTLHLTVDKWRIVLIV